MTALDWIVLVVTLGGMVGYGVYRSSKQKTLESYFLSNRSMPWWIVLLGIMGTQASAITFVSAPGQAYTDGMRFVQYYFGLPIAMIVISWVFIPIFQRLKVFTAYQYLENRFDRKTRYLAAILFLIGRGLSTGISVYAPAIIFSMLMGWNIYACIVLMGGVLIIYTVLGGAKSVAYTQQLQVLIILTGMGIAGYTAINLLPEGVGILKALKAGGDAGKMNIITSGNAAEGFNWKDKYNIWSGVIGGFFLALSYFGTDQSQVGRYLVAKGERESKLGLVMNGFVKVPMQFLILLIGVLVFAFYQYNDSPVCFNETLVEQAKQTSYADSLKLLENEFQYVQAKHKLLRAEADVNPVLADSLTGNIRQMEMLRDQYSDVLKNAIPAAESEDTNYIFLYFITHHLPKGLVGLLLAAIIMASWGSIAAALNSLAGSTVIDLHLPIKAGSTEDAGSYKWGWIYTLGWGVFCILIAMFATNMGSLIEAVNVLGSLFYGVILGIFLVAFFMKSIKGNAVFIAAIVAELLVIGIYLAEIISFLWLNVIGAAAVCIFAAIVQPFTAKRR